MNITYDMATKEDMECIYQFNKHLIYDYETMESFDYDRVFKWILNKLENRIDEYTTIYADGIKAGYYHFYKNEEGEYEIDDLYIFPAFQGKGIGTAVIHKCCSSVNEPVMLYVFIKNQRAVSLYQRLGFEVVKNVKDSRYIMRKG